MTKYTNRKSSVAPSFGEIPTHWKEIKTKYLFRFGRGLSISRENMSDEGVPCIHYGDIHGSYGFSINPAESSIGRVDESYLSTSPQAVVEYGDFLFVGSSEDVEGSGNFTYMNANISAIAGSDTITLRPINSLNCRFMAYLFDSIAYREQIRTKVYGVTVFHPTQSMIKNANAVLPSGLEQTVIVSYLDRRTAEIDTLINDLQLQSETLDRYKRELIAETVTKGLNKSVAMKDSGVDYIGTIPQHWELLSLFGVAKENVLKNIGHVCNNLLSLSYGKIIQKDIDTNFGLLPASFEGYQIVQPGYTVLRFTDLQNDKRSLRTGYVTETGIITSAYMGLIPSKRLDSKYFNCLLHTYDLLKVYYGMGGGLRQSLKFSDVKHLPIPIPPISEQQGIAALIDIKTAKIETLIADINMQIEKLKQYRQIVINDAVTGKIKITKEG